METADSTPLPEPCDEDEELTAAHYPLEGGPPTVHSRARPVAPGVSKQLILRGAGEPPASEDKCFGATAPAHSAGCHTLDAHAAPSPLPVLERGLERGG